ncbi:MAG: hypothetical protein WAK40_00840, partial [Thermoplasmata archaeon]
GNSSAASWAYTSPSKGGEAFHRKVLSLVRYRALRRSGKVNGYEFVRGLPRRSTREELIAYLEALVRLMQVEERRR